MAKPCKVLDSAAYQTLTRAACWLCCCSSTFTAAYVIRHQPHQAMSTTKCQRWWTYCRAAATHALNHLGVSQSSTSSSSSREAAVLPNLIETGWASCYLSAPVGRLCWSGGWCLGESKLQRDLNASPAAASSYPPLWGRPVARSESQRE